MLVLTWTATAQDFTEAMLGYAATTPPGGNPVSSPIFANISGPVGWTFQPTTDISVTALGALKYIVPRAGVEVGLWDSNGDLLASQAITSASTSVNQSLYQSITPVLLTADQTYYLAAYSAAGPLAAIAVTPDAAPNGYATMSPDILLGEAAYLKDSGFAFPATIDGSPGCAIIAPNFAYQVVPEPAVGGLLGAGAMVWLLARRRTKSASINQAGADCQGVIRTAQSH